MQYVIITPKKDEVQFVEEAIHSVIGQTVVPVEWIIVNDSSTNTTAGMWVGMLQGIPGSR